MSKKTTKKGRKTAKAAATDMSTGEATVEALLAHGIATVYALPGVHTDHLFDAFARASDRLRVVHARHEQGAAYMALGAALATGKPQTYSVVPGPGLLNSGAALLTAYGMNAPVLALIGQIPAGSIGHDQGHLHEIRDQAGIVARLVDHSAIINAPAEAPAKVAKAIRSMSTGRPGPAALECAIDVWGKRGPVARITPPAPPRPPKFDHDALRKAAKLLGKAKRVLIVVGGGAQHARPDVPVLSVNGDGGFMYTSNELATAMRHRIPLTAIVFTDGAFGNVRRIQEEQFGNRLIACDLANPNFVKYAESFGATGRRARNPLELRAALKASFAAREPTLIEVPVQAMPSPWEFIHMPPVRGAKKV